MLCATVGLALGVAADAHVVVSRITGDQAVGLVSALCCAAGLLALWQVWPWLLRRRTMDARKRGAS